LAEEIVKEELVNKVEAPEVVVEAKEMVKEELVNKVEAPEVVAEAKEMVEEKLSDKEGIDEKNIREIKETDIAGTEVDSEEKPKSIGTSFRRQF